MLLVGTNLGTLISMENRFVRCHIILRIFFSRISNTDWPERALMISLIIFLVPINAKIEEIGSSVLSRCHRVHDGTTFNLFNKLNPYTRFTNKDFIRNFV